MIKHYRCPRCCWVLPLSDRDGSCPKCGDPEPVLFFALPEVTRLEPHWTCPECKYVAPAEGWELGGACPGNMICPKCATEIDQDNHRAKPCGECEFCEMTA